MLKVTKHIVQNEPLNLLTAFIWHLTASEPLAINHILLPVLNTDLIINLSEPIFYGPASTAEPAAPNIHIRFVKKQPQIIRQTGKIDVWGVSFYAWGLYPFLKQPLNKLEGQVLDMARFGAAPLMELYAKLKNMDAETAGFSAVEAALGQWLAAPPDTPVIDMFKAFISNMDTTGIQEFCYAHGISIRQFERLAQKHTGLSPKQLQKIGRFQTAGNRLVYENPIDSLTSLAYEHNYYDQTHFIKEFKTFSGATPSAFIHNQNSIKGKLK